MPLALSALAGVLGCTIPVDDAGDTAFVHQALQAVLGRKPRGSVEVRALEDLERTYGRAAVVDVLLEQPEYVDYWTHVLADATQIQRSGDFAQKTKCTNKRRYLDDAGADASLLADHIRDASPTTAFTAGGAAAVEWNLHDALRAGIMVDDLHVGWRPFLFALAGSHQRGSELERRDNLMATAFGVRVDCVGCHASNYAATEVYDYETNDWDRASTLGYDLEVAAFGASSLIVDTSAATGDPTDPAQMFVNKCQACHGSDGTTRPLVAGYPSAKSLVRRVPLLTDAGLEGVILNGSGAMGKQSDLDGDGDTDDDAELAADLRGFLRDQLGGFADLVAYVDNAQFLDCSGASPPSDCTSGAFAGPWGITDDCGFHWSPTAASDAPSGKIFAGAASTEPDIGEIADAVAAGIAALPADVTIADPLAAGVRADAALPLPADRTVGPAALLTSQLVDGIIEELSGGRLRLVHGMARNAYQVGATKHLLGHLVVDDGTRVRLSLRGVLRELLLSDVFNRNAPRDTAPDPDLNGTAYQLPMWINPWAEVEPGGAVDESEGDDFNGQGDLLHRRSPNQLLWSLHHDLGWPAPEIDPGNQLTFPTSQFMTQIGRYEAVGVPGTTVWELDSLLLWENALGRCDNQGTSDDFIDALVAGTYDGTLSVADPLFKGSRPPRVRELLLTIKDRLLQEPVFSTNEAGESEETLVATFLAASVLGSYGLTTPVLDATATSFVEADLERVLRDYCGALLLSPDYLIAAVPTIRASPVAAPLSACLASEQTEQRCTEAEMYDAYAALAESLGYAALP
jgi:hypothetical protein